MLRLLVWTWRKTFGKRHDNVLRDIRELGCSSEFRLLNFEESDYTNAQGKKQPMIYMTRDGFTLLVMGYTGDLAMRFKEAYIKQFNAMEASLRGKLIERQKGIARSAGSYKGVAAIHRK